MAWTEKLPSGKYRGVYRDAFGKRRSAGTFPHKANALRRANAKEEDVRKSLTKNADAHKQTWGEWCETWWASRTVEAGTLKRDQSRRDIHLKPKWETIPLGQITRHDIKQWVAELRRPDDNDRVLANTTVQRIVHLFSASLNAAMDAEILAANPAARIKLPPAPPASDRFLSEEEYHAIVEKLPTVHDQLVMHVLVQTGIRFGEASGLRWRRVDLESGLLTVAEVYDERMKRMKAYPKGKKSRSVPLPGWLCEMLADRKAATKGRATDLVLNAPEGGTLIRSNWDNVFRNAVEAVNLGTEDEPVTLEDVTPHQLRHTYCSWLAQAGVPLVEIGRLAGHVSTATTARYAHLVPTDQSVILSALPAPQKPHADVIPIDSKSRHSRSDSVGPVGLEPTTRGLKVSPPTQDE